MSEMALSTKEKSGLIGDNWPIKGLETDKSLFFPGQQSIETPVFCKVCNDDCPNRFAGHHWSPRWRSVSDLKEQKNLVLETETKLKFLWIMKLLIGHSKNIKQNTKQSVDPVHTVTIYLCTQHKLLIRTLLYMISYQPI